ncbi:MAG: serine hydrolase, partial [Woeseiaceae bacterium]
DDREVDGEMPRHNSYQWDFVMDDGDFFKGGFGGQGLYISPSRDLVIAFFGTFDADEKGHEMTRIARQLAKSGLFN